MIINCKTPTMIRIYLYTFLLISIFSCKNQNNNATNRLKDLQNQTDASDKDFNKLTINQEAVYPYLNYEPESFEKDKEYALLIFLHGAGERGTDLEMLKVHGPPMQITNGKKFDCHVLAPLCPLEVWWDEDRLEETLKDFMNKHKVDKQKIYLTGLSMGGYATWKWACKYPDHFAAIAPICGGGDPENVKAIKDIPTWAFHGAKDKVVDISESQKMVDALIAIDAEPKFTIYPEANHNSWTETYNNPEFYKWLFSHTK